MIREVWSESPRRLEKQREGDVVDVAVSIDAKLVYLTLLATELLVAQPATGDARVAPRAASIAIVTKKKRRKREREQRDASSSLIFRLCRGKMKLKASLQTRKKRKISSHSVVREPV